MSITEGTVAGFQSSMMSYYVLLILAFHSFIGQSTAGFVKCDPEYTAVCGSPADIVCYGSSNITEATVMRKTPGPKGPKDETLFVYDPSINRRSSQDGRVELILEGLKATVRIHHSNLSDSGDYRVYLRPKDTTGYTEDTKLRIIVAPTINMTWIHGKVVCEAIGGSPVDIQWSDRHGTDWTKSATSEEEGGRLSSTLTLRPSSVMEEYYCTVTYQLRDKTQQETRCIARPGLETGCGDDSKTQPQDSETDNKNGLYVLLPIAGLLFAFMVFVLYTRRPYLRRDARLLPAPHNMKDAEKAVEADFCDRDTSEKSLLQLS